MCRKSSEPLSRRFSDRRLPSGLLSGHTSGKVTSVNTSQLPCPACYAEDVKVYAFLDGKIASCRRCRLQWAMDVNTRNAQFDDTLMPQSYYIRPESVGDPRSYPPFQRFFDMVEMHIPSRSLRILDVGCGSGAFVAACLDRGHDAFGVELNPVYADYTPPAIADRIRFGVPAEDMDWSDVPLMDIITFWDCLEHVPSPFALLESIRGRLSDGGILYLRLNNRHDVFNYATDFLLRVCPPLGRKMLRGCFNFPMHAWNFSLNAVSRLMDAHEWEIMAVSFSDTPPSRLTRNPAGQFLMHAAYGVNRIIGGGKIGDYYIRSC